MELPILATILALILLAPRATVPAAAQTPTTGPVPGPAVLVDALSHIPDSPAARESTVGFIDLRAMEAARPGAAQPGSFAQLQHLRDANDPAARLWLAAALGLTEPGLGARSGELIGALFEGGQEWPTLVGFDPFDVDQVVSFGRTPFSGVALLGRFDPAAVSRAFEARGYVASETGERILLCGPEGCESGLTPDFTRIDAGIPFGGASGRTEPIAVSSTDLLGSADDTTLRGMLDAETGSASSMMDDPDARAAVEAIDHEGSLIQAQLIPARLLERRPATTQPPEDAAAFEPIAPYRLVAVADRATEKEQVVSIVLVYERATDAADAADVLVRRLSVLHSTLTGEPLQDLLADRGVTSIIARVVPTDQAGRAAAVVTLRAPLAGSEPDPATGSPRPSSSVYQLLVRMIAYGDTLWLAPDLPAAA